LINDINAILEENDIESLFLFSDSYKDDNIFYLTKFLAPDPFIFLKRIDQEPILIVNQMEYSRAKKESIIKDVRSYYDYNYLNTVTSFKDLEFGKIQFITNLIKRELDIGKKIFVPSNFPLFFADMLRAKGLKIEPVFGLIEKARETKDKQEIEIIKKIQRINEKITSEAIEFIANSCVGTNKTLIQNGEPLTVGKVKTFFGQKLLENNCIAEEDIIVACGTKSSDPHYLGKPEDKLKANQPIILDIYPRSIENRYWTDMTRTVVRGKASKELKKMFNAVFNAKNSCIDAIYRGITGKELYDICCDVLEKLGYQSTRGSKKITSGMTHSLGHGVGLQIHEMPRIDEFCNSPLKKHAVITIEPGLYNPKIGGMRLEDILEVTRSGSKNLTHMETILEV
jgi:Xaa-Pro aminopeptidase